MVKKTTTSMVENAKLVNALKSKDIVSISRPLSIDLASSFSMERMDTSSNLSWAILDLKNALINLSLEKDLSAVATVTGIVAKRKSFVDLRNEELTRLSNIKSIKSTVAVFSFISSRNSL